MRIVMFLSLGMLLAFGGCGPASGIQEGMPEDTTYVPPPPVMGPNTNFKNFAKAPQQVKAKPVEAPPPGKVE